MPYAGSLDLPRLFSLSFRGDARILVIILLGSPRTRVARERSDDASECACTVPEPCRTARPSVQPAARSFDNCRSGNNVFRASGSACPACWTQYVCVFWKFLPDEFSTPLSTHTRQNNECIRDFHLFFPKFRRPDLSSKKKTLICQQPNSLRIKNKSEKSLVNLSRFDSADDSGKHHGFRHLQAYI